VALLTLTPVFAGPGAGWYEDAVALTETDYSAGAGEWFGYWVGDPDHPDRPDEAGGELPGPAARQAARLLVGETPGPRPAPGRRWGGLSGWGFGAAAYDFTFFAPKSVSLAAKSMRAQREFGAAEAIDAAFQLAWSEAMEWFDCEKSYVYGRDDDGTVGPLEHDGLIGVAYPHRMDRAGNPHLHAHVVISRHAMRDGERLHLDIRSLRGFVPRIEARYRARLRVELETVGWELHPLGTPDQDELVGVPARTLKKWTDRRGPCRWMPPACRRAARWSARQP